MRRMVAACAVALGVASGARAQGVRRAVVVPRDLGLSLASASRIMQYAADVTFFGDSVQSKNGIVRLTRGASGLRAALATTATGAPLAARASYAVNDGTGRTYVLKIVALNRTAVTVTVRPASAPLRWKDALPREALAP
jgi:hypothetical protein